MGLLLSVTMRTALLCATLILAQETTAVVEKGNLTVSLEFDGSFEPAEGFEVRIRPEALGAELTVRQAVEHGRSVKAGDTILTLEAKNAEEIVAAAEADVEATRAARDRAEEDSKLSDRAEALAHEKAKRDKLLADQKLQVFKQVDQPMALAASDQGVVRLQDSIDDQKEELAQLEKMYKSEELTNATAEIVVMRARRRLERSAFDLEQAKERAKKLKEIDLPNQLDQLVREAAEKTHALEAYEKLAPFGRAQKKAELAKLRIAARKAETQLERIRQDLEALTVKAPSDGVVYYGRCLKGKWEGTEDLARNLRPGEKAAANQVLMTVVGKGLRFRTETAEADVMKFSVGAQASIVPAALPDSKIEGSVASIAPVSGGGGFETRMSLAQAPERLVPGMKGKATIVLEELRDVLLVPSVFVLDEGGKKICHTRDGVKEVTVGKSSGKKTQILSGLAAGDVVILPKR
jgi:HlyD family secretion protein